MREYIVSLDQGTSSSRAIVFDKKGQVVGVSQKEHKQIYPKEGWVEHNPEEILKNQKLVFKQVVKKCGVKAEQISSIGITNQRETIVAWNKKTGRPIYNAIVWQDNRTEQDCNKLIKKNYSNIIRKKTGLFISTYFSATKIAWILKNIPESKILLKKNSLLIGTIDSWLLWCLTKGESFYTDYTNASRTMLFNINTLVWDKELLALFKIPKKILPKALPSSSCFGRVLFNGKLIPVGGLAGDQQAALFGQQCFKKGDGKNTYGTGCFLLLNTGKNPFLSPGGLLTTIACSFSQKPNYALEGSVFVGGAVMQWLRDNLCVLPEIEKSSSISKKEKESSVFFVPAFSGFGAPYWDMNARGGIFGLTQKTNKNQIIKAALESLAFQSKDVLDVMEKDSGFHFKKLCVDGGASKNNYLMQFQSDILNKKIVRTKSPETTSLGVAFLAGLTVGFWSEKEIKSLVFKKKVFSAAISGQIKKKRLLAWKKAVSRCKNWV